MGKEALRSIWDLGLIEIQTGGRAESGLPLIVFSYSRCG